MTAGDGKGRCFVDVCVAWRGPVSAVMASPAAPGSILDPVRALQHALYRAAKADPGRRFHALRDKVYRRDVLWRAWVAVRRNDGAPGIDTITLGQVEQYGVGRLLDELAIELKDGRYRPLPARRVFIPKPGTSEQRPLSIPSVRDRIVQAAVKIVLEPVFEAQFLPCSFGFRPRRSVHDALQVLIEESWRGRRWVVETDIANCFSAIPHRELMQAVEERVSDQAILKLLRAMLRAGVMEDGQVRRPVTGSPQGALCSAEHKPANEQCWVMRSVGLPGLVRTGSGDEALRIARGSPTPASARTPYATARQMHLNEAGAPLPYVRDILGHVDLPMTRRLHAQEVMCSVGPHDVALSRHHRRTLRITQHCSLGGVISPLLCNVYLHRLDRAWSTREHGVLVRFADDVLVMCKSREQAEAALQQLRHLLADLGLQPKEAKTRIVHLQVGGGGVDFLGFHHRLVRSRPRDGRHPVTFLARWPANKAMQHARDRIRELTDRRRLRLPVEHVMQDLNAFLRGWAGFFRYGHSAERLSKIRQYVRMRIALFISKRHRRSRHFGTRALLNFTPNEFGLISLYGIVVPPRAGKPWREKPNAGGERRR